MTRTVYLRDAFANSVASGLLAPATRSAVLRHYNQRIYAEWLAAQYLAIETWGWN